MDNRDWCASAGLQRLRGPHWVVQRLRRVSSWDTVKDDATIVQQVQTKSARSSMVFGPSCLLDFILGRFSQCAIMVQEGVRIGGVSSKDRVTSLLPILYTNEDRPVHQRFHQCVRRGLCTPRTPCALGTEARNRHARTVPPPQRSGSAPQPWDFGRRQQLIIDARKTPCRAIIAMTNKLLEPGNPTVTNRVVMDDIGYSCVGSAVEHRPRQHGGAVGY
jgi:hypothetical protein